MSSRRYPTAELYEERQRDFYRNGDRTNRNYEDLDLEISHSHSHGNPRRSAPDLFRDDFDSRPTAGAMVVRERREEEITRAPPARRREVESDTLVIRGGRPAPPPPASSVREVEREDITIRHGARDAPRRGRETEETDITIRHRDQSRPARPEPPREVEREEILFRRGDGARPGRPSVDFEREEVRFKGRAQSRPREVEREEYHFHRDDSRHGGKDTEIEKDTLIIRGRERSLPPPRRGELVAREHEEFVMRRRETSPPPPPRDMVTKDEIIIRRREARSPSPPPPPPPPPEPEPIVKPPIIQEIITHHRHIDHGVERARSPTPPPPPPSPPREEQLEISIRRRDTHGRGGFEEDIIYERDTFERKSRDFGTFKPRAQSSGSPRRSFTAPVQSDFEREAGYYNRKALERGFPGEARNGATKYWSIVDVPPGTKRVRMDGIGGAAQAVTWQTYNGVRRSKSTSGENEITTNFGHSGSEPVKPKPKDMWTEITKDLVLKDAIDAMGYEYEETDQFFYVMDYLKYEDVLQLVEISDEIRRKRKSRIRQIEYERSEIRRPASDYDRFSEHEVIYDRHSHRYR